MDDGLFSYEVRIPRLSGPLYDKPQCDNLENYDHEVYEQNLCYDEEEKSYAEAVIFINKSYKQQFNDYVEIKRKNYVFEHDTDMEYDPSDVEFAEWMDLKFSNHSTMDWYTKNALWMYWIRGDDEEVLTEKELSDHEETYANEEDEIAEIFRIKTNIFNIETPFCKAFNEFNYLLKIDTDFLTHDIPRFLRHMKNTKTHRCMNGMKMCHGGHVEWPTCRSNDDGYCDGRDLPGMIQNKNMVYFQDYECHAGKRNEEEIKEPMNDYGIGDSGDHLVSNNAPDYANDEEEQYKERFEVIKYSFGPTEEFVAIKECGYDDWMRTKEDACHAYQDIFTKMDKGWFVTRAE
ncbi:hypothetical protein Tco_0624927 [Tanacetum coccineum]|uniref:Uncharacterized protein n=1 Tax=Tanacetum coccineum TaxID=301880 RepID=A0ABQ4WFG5_9ASTR